MREVELTKGDKVVFSTLDGKVEGKVIETYEGDYIKVRYGKVFPSTKIVNKVLLHDVKRNRNIV